MSKDTLKVLVYVGLKLVYNPVEKEKKILNEITRAKKRTNLKALNHILADFKSSMSKAKDL